MKKNLINKILNFVRPSSGIDLSGIPATDVEISNAEKILNVKFHDDYIDFIKEFGGAYAGIPIYAFQNNEMLSNETVIDLTKSYRDDYKDDFRDKIINESYVISVDDMGNPILINEKGNVLIFYHDSDEYHVITENLSQLIEGVIDGNSIYDFK